MRGDGRSHKRVVALSSRKARIAQAMKSSVRQTGNAQHAAHHCTGDAPTRYNLMQAERGGNERPAYRSPPLVVHRRRVVEAQDDENRERERDEQMVGSIVRRHGCARGNGRDGRCG
jgi:hypothetical protein